MKLSACVSQPKPVAERDFDERHAALDQPPGEQAALAELAGAVLAAHFVGLVRQIERGPHFGPHHVGGLAVQARGGRRTRRRLRASRNLRSSVFHSSMRRAAWRGVDAGRQLEVVELQLGEVAPRCGRSAAGGAAAAAGRRSPARSSAPRNPGPNAAGLICCGGATLT